MRNNNTNNDDKNNTNSDTIIALTMSISIIDTGPAPDAATAGGRSKGKRRSKE